MRKSKTWLIILAVILVVAGGMLLCVVFQPDPGPPYASVTLLGFTNDASGARLARFAITNLSRFPVYRASRYDIMIPLHQYWEFESSGYIPSQRVIGAGASETLMVPAPTNQPAWRIGIMVYTDPGHTAVSQWEKAVALVHATLTPGYRVNWYSIRSGVLTNGH